MIYLCCDKRRRLALRDANAARAADGLPPVNGIDYLEVLDGDAPPGVARQRTLLVRLFEPVPPPGLDRDDLRLTGGERIRPVGVVWAHPAAAVPAADAPAAERASYAALPAADRTLVVRTDSAGDYSRYRLAVVRAKDDPSPPAGFDPQFAAVEFSFKVECPSDFDCRAPAGCPSEPEPPPPADYLAKDYAGFRRLMLDRLSLLVPGWRDRSAADLGVTLVELLAFVGDRLSYQQDATATEAYLDTARRRVSVRRHARLVDYRMHDGCNARAWVRVLCGDDAAGEVLPAGTVLLTKVLPPDPTLAPGSAKAADARARGPVVFETVHPRPLFAAHRQINLYAWGDGRCCLPTGATRATLAGDLPNLAAGDVLVLAEVVGPRTGAVADADPTRRHPVRLTAVRPSADPLNDRSVTEITWDRADALPFPVCVSSVTDPAHGGDPVDGVSVAWGNVVLADHGETVPAEDLGVIPQPRLHRPGGFDRCEPADPRQTPARYNPALGRLPLTQTIAISPARPAAEALDAEPAAARPAVELINHPPDRPPADGDPVWKPQPDLLGSGPTAAAFVVEVEHDGRTRVRFGDDAHGMRPAPGTRFTARYRTGNGAAGNVGAGALFHVITNVPVVTGVTNPLPARGGVEPESADEVRHRAPEAFRTQERAVTEADYAEAAGRDGRVQRAAATFRWTGSWHTVYLTADRRGGPADDPAAFRREVLAGVERYRMAGHDLEADEPRYVSLEIALHVCVKPGYFRSEVGRALAAVFGRRGVFHPDNFTFGQPVYLSPLYAAAQAIPGVASVQVTTFQRQGQPSNAALQTGRLDLGRLEIARLDNDPNFPEHGVFSVALGGGK